MIPLSEKQRLDANAETFCQSAYQPEKKDFFVINSETIPLLEGKCFEESTTSSNSLNEDVIQTFLTCNSEDTVDDRIEVFTGVSVRQSESIDNQGGADIFLHQAETRELHEGQKAELDESQENAENISLPQDDQRVFGDADNRKKEEQVETEEGDFNAIKEKIQGNLLIASSPIKSFRTSSFSAPNAFPLAEDRNDKEEENEEESIEVVLGII